MESSTRLGGFRALKKTTEAPYTTKVNNRSPTSRGPTRNRSRAGRGRVPRVWMERGGAGGEDGTQPRPIVMCACVGNSRTVSVPACRVPLGAVHRMSYRSRRSCARILATVL